MSEVVLCKTTGCSVKIGTCENMYYTSYERMKKELPNLGWIEGNLQPEQYFNYPDKILWRFPFEDEKQVDFCDVDNFERSETFSITKESAESLIGKEVQEQEDYILSIAQQKVVGDYLMPMFNISGREETWVCDNKEDVEAVIEAIQSGVRSEDSVKIFCSQLLFYANNSIDDIMKLNDIIADLTTENAHKVSTIINKAHPEWGTKRFNYKAQDLNDGECCHTHGSGSNSAILFDEDFHFWGVVSFKEEQSANYLPLFDDINITKEQKISQEDLQRCELFQSLLEGTLAQLSKWYDVFNDAVIEETKTNDFFKVGSYNRIEKKHYYPDNDADAYNQFKFTPLFDVKHIESLWNKALYRFENDIVKHFNNKYNLRFENLHVLGDKEMGTIPSYTEIVDYVLKMLDGKTFEDMQHEYTLNDFRSVVRYSPEVKKDSIVFPSFCTYDYKPKMRDLCKAIGYFEKLEITEITDLIRGWNSDKYNLGETFDLNSSKAISIRTYQNGRVDLKFTDQQAALAFYHLYNLQDR